MQILIFRWESEFALSDSLCTQVPNECVVYYVSLRVFPLFVCLGGVAVHDENVRLELPHIVDGD